MTSSHFFVRFAVVTIFILSTSSAKTKEGKGLVKDVDRKDTKTLIELSEYALETLDTMDPHAESKRVLKDILSARKELLVALGSDEKICDISVLKSWAATDISPVNAQLVKSECSDQEGVYSEMTKRLKREAKKWVGRKMPIDTNDAEIAAKARFALSKMDTSTGRNCARDVAKIVEANKQVVSGILTEMKMLVCEQLDCSPNNNECESCTISLWEQPWLNFSEVTKYSCEPSKHVTKRSFKGLIGARRPLDTEAEKVRNLASRIMEKQNADKGEGECSRKVARILHASERIENGIRTFLKMIVCDTRCPASEQDGKSLKCDLCDVSALEHPWMRDLQVKTFDCQPSSPLEEGKKNNRMSSLYDDGGDSVTREEFETFVQTYAKVYPNEKEKAKRHRIFRANLKKIRALQRNEQGTATYGVTEFADLTREEFRRRYLGFRKKDVIVTKESAVIPNVELPDEFDWRNHNVVTPVKNQGSCGSCWAFSVTGNVEGQYALKHGKLLSLSEQELVDCDKEDEGCNGGYMNQAYDAIEELGGLELESDYPYDGVDEKCKFDSGMAKVRLSSSVNITTNETEMAQWLFKNGPISVALNAFAMQFYFGGVSHPLKVFCNPGELDHGVLLVGFGVQRGHITRKMLPYWLIKNSWGTSWGEQGYYKLYRGSGACGVNLMATSAIVE